MQKISTFKNGLTLIAIDLPHLDSVTTMVAVGAGSRYENKKVNGLSHFLEHMFFKGSRKYPTAEIIANLVDGIGAINNAATSKEFTFYWIKSAAEHLEMASDILSSMLKEPLLSEEEINREKGVIVEETRMIRDNPQRYVFDLYEELLFGNQPLGWNIVGNEKIVQALCREDFVAYLGSLYSPKNMAVIYAGKLPKDIEGLAEKYFSSLPDKTKQQFIPYKKVKQTKSKVAISYKKTDQANLILGVESFDRNDPRQYPAEVLGVILGEGMSSRLFIQVRERRGLAYHIAAGSEDYSDTGTFLAYGGLKLEKVMEGLGVIKAELERTAAEKVTDEELKKAKEIIKGRTAIRAESTNFLAEYFGTRFVLDKKVETFEEYFNKIDEVTAEDVRAVAGQLFQPEKYNLQIIGPFRDKKPFEEILQK